MTKKEIALLMTLLNKLEIELPLEDKATVEALIELIDEDYEY